MAHGEPWDQRIQSFACSQIPNVDTAAHVLVHFQVLTVLTAKALSILAMSVIWSVALCDHLGSRSSSSVPCATTSCQQKEISHAHLGWLVQTRDLVDQASSCQREDKNRS